MNNELILSWLLDAAMLIALALLAVAMAFGLLLALAPRRALGLAERLNRQHSARRSMKPLEIPRPIEPFFYRHHRATGLLLLIGVVAFFTLWMLDYPRDSITVQLAQHLSAPLAAAVMETLETFFVIANALIGILALVILLRPSLLKPLESTLNRWFTLRRALRDAEETRLPVDRFTAEFPRTTGLLVVAGCAYVAIALWIAAR